MPRVWAISMGCTESQGKAPLERSLSVTWPSTSRDLGPARTRVLQRGAMFSIVKAAPSGRCRVSQSRSCHSPAAAEISQKWSSAKRVRVISVTTPPRTEQK